MQVPLRTKSFDYAFIPRDLNSEFRIPNSELMGATLRVMRQNDIING